MSQADLSDLTDEQLVERLRMGQAGAFETLLRRYQQELLNFLVRFCSDRGAGEDVFQETFLQVHLSAATFDTDRRFKPWLFTIAANKARDYMRKRARRPAGSLDAPVGRGQGEHQSFVDLLEADWPLPEEELTSTELARRVQAAVADLPEHLSQILVLAYFQKFSYQQIAEMLEIPLGTVKSRLHTAVGAFAKTWKKVNPRREPT